MSFLRTDRDNRVLTVTLNHPPYNFLNIEILDELYELLARVADDSSIGSVVITSAIDGIFISHHDVAELLASSEAVGNLSLSPALAGAALRAEATAERVPGVRAAMTRTLASGAVTISRYHQLAALMNRMDKVVIAAINGRALGGGSELALACDIRFMADGDFEIGQPEICLGLIPGGGGTQRLPSAVGRARALELILEGELLTPRQAQQIGYVNRVVAPDELMAEAHATAARLARRSPAAVAAAKRAVYRTAETARGLHAEGSQVLAVATTPAARRAMRAYLDHLDALEQAGQEMTAAALASWVDGTAIDLTT